MNTFSETLSHILVFKTNIASHSDVEKVAFLLDEHDDIIRWNVDCEDIDKVLRIEGDQLEAHDVIRIVQAMGYECEELPD
jgi:hypothetical protein